MSRFRVALLCVAAFVGGAAALSWVQIVRNGTSRNDDLVGVACAVVTVAVAARLWTRRTELARLAAVFVAVAALAPVALFLVGEARQVTVDGAPVWSLSDRARASRQARAVEDDLTYVATADELFSFDLAGVRANLGAFERARLECAGIAENWSGTRGVTVELGAAVKGLVSTADLCARTAQGYLEAAETGDMRVVDTATALRAAYIDAAVGTGRDLAVAAQLAGVELGAARVTE